MDARDIFEKGQTVIQLEIQALRELSDHLDSELFSQAVLTLQDALARRSKIVVLGIGKSGNIGHKLAATLNSTGAPTVVLNSQNALHGDLGIVSAGDVVLALSQSGETPELLQLLPHVKRLDTFIIAMTGRMESTLAQESDLVLDTRVEREACPLNLAPTSSTTVMLVLGDALAMALLEARGFSDTDFARYHPGGSLGRALLTRVKDIMRTDRKLPLAAPEDSVLTALETMRTARSGACIIADSAGELAGIFTHGDFARAFEQSAVTGQTTIGSLMTRDPISVSSESLVAEALRTIGQNRVDDIVVLGPAGKPVGLIDTQDLARLRIV